MPRRLTLAEDRVLFLRGEGDDPRQSLWVLDAGGERLVVDAEQFLTTGDSDIPAEEQARRERTRERGSGIVAYACDRAARQAAFEHGGKLLVADVDHSTVRQLAVDGPAVDPRLDPTGDRIAYVQDQAVWTVRADGTNAPRRLVADSDPQVSWGLAEFVAAEEMGRTRGYWWAPDGRSLLVARVDVTPVRTWWIAAAVDPDARPTQVRYPAAGTDNARVGLALVGLDGRQVPVSWDDEELPYLADVVWEDGHPPVLVVQSRDQQTVSLLGVDTATGQTTELAREFDTPWIELVPGNPAWLPDGQLVRIVQTHDTRRVEIDGVAVGDTGLMVTELVGVEDDAVIVTADVRQRPWCSVVARIGVDDSTMVLSDPDGVTHAVMGGGRLAIVQRTPASAAVTVIVDGIGSIRSQALTPPDLGVHRHEPVGGGDRPVTQVFVPADWTPAEGPLPVLLDPYGGPGSRRVVGAGGANLTSAWFAANGFAVVVTDGPGSPGQSLSWTGRIAGDFAGPTLEGQVQAFDRAVEAYPGLFDTDRVAIRGWSFGGYLAALAVLRRPDVFAAAISGAPVTDWRLYDTHYTERYLGHPVVAGQAYDRSSIVEDAASLQRPLLLIHGLADDNVVAAHTLRLSRALLESGRSHQVLPLSGVTHFTPSEEVNANLLLLQLEFLCRSLEVRDVP